jgi:hypothetical protein
MPKHTRRSKAATEASKLTRISDEELLETRICDLGLRIVGTALERHIQQLYSELSRKGLRFRPPCWLSTEWFSPNRVPGIAIPFYLAHPRLARLENRMMLEVEGGTRTWCMQLLRHEAGHAFETAYQLGRRKRWRQLFGSSSKPYPDYYSPQPVSHGYVLHLDWWYAQSHPCEDFAETFAVWLRPKSNWRRQYAGWPALRKLEYVDELMGEIGTRPPVVRTRRQVDPIRTVRTTLRELYVDKRERYGESYPDVFDRDLRRLFPDLSGRTRRPAASAYLRRIGPAICGLVAGWTGTHTYAVNRVLKDMIRRSRELDLRVGVGESELQLQVAILLTMQTMEFVYSTHHKIAL